MEFDTTQKTILKMAGVGCGMMAAFVVVAGYFFIRAFVAPEFRHRHIDRAEDVGKVGVRIGRGFFRTSTVFKDEKLGIISDIDFGKLDPNPKVAMVVVGQKTADFLSSDRKVLRVQQFSPRVAMDYPDMIDIKGEGSYEWIGDCQTRKGRGLRVLSHDGKLLWEYCNPDLRMMSWCPGFPGGSKQLQFIVSGVNGLDLVDSHGKQIWHRPDGNVWHVSIADIDGDGKREIVHSNVGGELVIRDAQGHIRSSCRLSGPGLFPYYLGRNFLITRWMDSRRRYVLYPTDKDFRVADYRGKLVARLAAPVVCRDSWVTAGPLKLFADKPEYLAVLAVFSEADRSVLYLYDSQQRLVYMEVLPERAYVLRFGRFSGTTARGLLIGGKGRVVEYAPVVASQEATRIPRP